MRIGDSVRVYQNDNFFIEGKISDIIVLVDKIYTIHVDWGEWISYYLRDELKLEHRDGVWSWRPPHEGIILSSKV